MIIKTEEELHNYRVAGEISVSIVRELANNLKVGIYPSVLNDMCWELCKKNNVEPAFFGVEMNDSVFPASCNINVNDEVLHSIPSSSRKLENGDVVKIDFGIIYKGLYTDHCYTFILGTASQEDERLVKTAKLATEKAVEKAIVGNTTGDLGFTMESIATLAGFSVLENYVGHGIGQSLHDDPPIPAYGIPGKGHKLKEGMVICIESQVVAGRNRTYIADDDWTVKTSDGKKGAMFEYVVIVGKKRPEILTKMQGWEIFIR